MELMIIGMVGLVILTWVLAHPRPERVGPVEQTTRRPRLWDDVSSTAPTSFIGAVGSGTYVPSGHTSGSSHHGTSHDAGFLSSTNAPSDGGHFGGDGGGWHSGADGGGGHHGGFDAGGGN